MKEPLEDQACVGCTYVCRGEEKARVLDHAGPCGRNSLAAKGSVSSDGWGGQAPPLVSRDHVWPCNHLFATHRHGVGIPGGGARAHDHCKQVSPSLQRATSASHAVRSLPRRRPRCGALSTHSPRSFHSRRARRHKLWGAPKQCARCQRARSAAGARQERGRTWGSCTRSGEGSARW